ncbi:MAG: KpsF/GutQ family sugar-phosphate isomerase [Planctomycetota bacterium]|jgi:arabinose-5-phosphate isomerase
MTLEYAKEVLKAEISAIESVSQNLGTTFIRALDLIVPEENSKHRIIACGIGKAGIIAQKIAATLASTGTESVFMHPSDALHGDLGIVRQGDIALILSNSGESDEISKLLPFLRKHDLKIIAVTSSTRSTLGVQADIVLELGNLQEACPLGLAPTASTTAMLALGDALAMALMKRRDFTVSDYARFHPAGELGRKSFTVAEVMRGEEAVAFVHQETPVSEVIKQISKARAGAGIVIDNEGKLLGIFTDGDLRRGMIDDNLILAQPVMNVMIHNPESITPESSAAEALEIMRKKRIGEVPVIDNTGRAVGMIDLKGLLAEGIS